MKACLATFSQPSLLDELDLCLHCKEWMFPLWPQTVRGAAYTQFGAYGMRMRQTVKVFYVM